jgi:4-hydroxy 2-oxovalerate aldolase
MSVRLVDVTLREAGLANGYSFTLAQATAIARALDRAGIANIELGYRRPRLSDISGAACPPAYISSLRAVCKRAELGVMIHHAEVTIDEYARLRDQGLGLVRFALAASEFDALAVHARAACAAGLHFTVNLTRVSEVPPEVAIDVARAAEDAGARCFYVADSNGSLYPHRVATLASRLRAAVGIALGFHAHDNLRLAFANALVALSNGFTWIDASLGGAGKGGGNLILELIAAHLGIYAGHDRPDVLALARAHHEFVEPAMPASRQSCHALFGLLDYNMDKICKLSHQAEHLGIPLDAIAVEAFNQALNGTDDIATAPTSRPFGRITAS